MKTVKITVEFSDSDRGKLSKVVFDSSCQKIAASGDPLWPRELQMFARIVRLARREGNYETASDPFKKLNVPD